MVEQVETGSIDLRYEGYRMKNFRTEKELLGSIALRGIQDALEGVDKAGIRILLNGFKRYRCAKKLGIEIVPYISLGSDEATGIIYLLRVSNEKGLSILEQARLIDDLKRMGMSTWEIAQQLSRSKSWVSVRIGICTQMSEAVKENIFSGKLPVYSYIYTLRQFIQNNNANKNEIDEFVNAVSGKGLSIRDIECLASGYFKGSETFRQQFKCGNISWCLERMRKVRQVPDGCNSDEQKMLNNLETAGKYMQRISNAYNNKNLKSKAFHAQANLLTSGILSRIKQFAQAVRSVYDRTRQT